MYTISIDGIFKILIEKPNPQEMKLG